KKTVTTVSDVVDTVRTKVEDTVQVVTSSVEQTVAAVKSTLDIPQQVRRHPYGMMGGALLTGMAMGWLVSRERRSLPRSPAPRRRPTFHGAATAFEAAPPASEERPGFFASLMEPLAGEFEKIKATAIGALMGMARDAIGRAVPANLA